MITILFLFAIVEEEKFSGKHNVEPLGTVSFPPGKWKLEKKLNPGPRNEKTIRVFKRTDVKHDERIAFSLVHPDSTVRPKERHFDSIGDSYSEGFPYEIAGDSEAHYGVRLNKQLMLLDGEKAKWSSVKWLTHKKPNWTAHHFVADHNGWIIICVYSSNGKIRAKHLKNIYRNSSFELPKSRESQKTKEPRLPK